jgi:hypothetical protein
VPRKQRSQVVTVEDLVDRGAHLVRDFSNVESSKTAILKDLARVVVELRSRFHTDDGRTDWAGRSGPYREAVARIYSEAGVPTDSLDGMQAALRYHVGNVLREVAPAEELEDLGLKAARPVDRVKETRDRLAALARAGAAAEGTGNKRADVFRMVTGAEVLLTRVTDDVLADLPAERVEDLVTSLEHVVARASELLADLQGTRTKRRGGRRRASLTAV